MAKHKNFQAAVTEDRFDDLSTFVFEAKKELWPAASRAAVVRVAIDVFLAMKISPKSVLGEADLHKKALNKIKDRKT